MIVGTEDERAAAEIEMIGQPEKLRPEQMKPTDGLLQDRNTLRRLPVIEIFGPTIQGEGALVGQTTHFVRFGGCSYRCSWCDSMHAVDPVQIKRTAVWATQDEILQRVKVLAHRRLMWVTLSGGDPCLWELAHLVGILQLNGYRVAVETQGAHNKEWLMRCDLVTLSPKPPSSEMHTRTNFKALGEQVRLLRDKCVIKVVIKDSDDLNWAMRLKRTLPKVPFYLSAYTPRPVGGEPKSVTAIKVSESLRFLAEAKLQYADLDDAITLPQMHALIWGHDKGR